MELSPPTADVLLLLQRQNETLDRAVSALTGNISESLKTINFLQHENTRLNEAIRVHDVRAVCGESDRPTSDPQRVHQHPECDTPPTIPLLQRISNHPSLADRISPVTFPSISGTPVIVETSRKFSPTVHPPPPQLLPTVGSQKRAQEWGLDFRGEGVRKERE